MFFVDETLDLNHFKNKNYTQNAPKWVHFSVLPRFIIETCCFFLHVSSFVLAAAGFSLFSGGGVFLIENAGEKS